MNNQSTSLTPSEMGLVPGEEVVSGSVTASEQTRAMQEVQASILMAMRYPRNEDDCRKSLLRACERQGLAEQAQYVYPKGNTKVSGPAIRLLEEAARQWKHIDSGWRIIQESPKGATVMAYAWDMQMNTRTRIEFFVEYTRKAGGRFNRIEDPREQYEHVANMSSRRLRACLQKIIPAYIIDEAIEQCDKTLNADPEVKASAMLEAFDKLGVTQEMIEKRIGHKVEALTKQEVVNLKKIYTSLRDGFGPIAQYFEGAAQSERNGDEDTGINMKPKRGAKKETPPEPETKEEELPVCPTPEDAKKAQEGLGLGDLQ